MFSENECLLRLILSFITYKDVYEKVDTGFLPITDVIYDNTEGYLRCVAAGHYDLSDYFTFSPSFNSRIILSSIDRHLCYKHPKIKFSKGSRPANFILKKMRERFSLK